ncbi:MAG: hypothetical protein ABJN24_07805 [Hyphomicrobiales bacterium]
MLKKLMRFFSIIYFVIVITALLGSIGYMLVNFPPEAWDKFAHEGGIIESTTAIIFGLVALLAFILFFKIRAKIWLYFGFLMAAASMREMDLHRAWTTDSIFKLRFYSGDAAPFYEKILGLLFILVLVFTLVQFIRHIPSWISNVLKFQPMALSIFMGLGTLALGKLLDSMARVLPFMADFHGNNRPLLRLLEESLEMTSSFFFLLTCLLALLFKTIQNQEQTS